MKREKEKVRIATWNLGQYIWMGYLGRFFPINGYKNKIQNYNRGNADKIKEIIDLIDPDIFIGQELSKNTDISEFWNKISIYKLSPSYYKNFQKLYIGEVEPKLFFKEKHKELTIIQLPKYIIFLVHLNAFSAHKRLKEIEYICQISDCYKKPIICLGDFNIWKRGNFFLFKKDRLAYKKITEYFDHPTKHIISTTTTGFSLDNIFTKNIYVTDSGVKKDNGKYMDHYPIWIDFEI